MKKFLTILSTLIISSVLANENTIEASKLDSNYDYEFGECSKIREKYKEHQLQKVLKNGKVLCYVKQGFERRGRTKTGLH